MARAIVRIQLSAHRFVEGKVRRRGESWKSIPAFFRKWRWPFFKPCSIAWQCVLAGAAFIALSVYIVLVCSEMFSQPRSKSQRPRVAQLAYHPPVAEESLDLSDAESTILPVPEHLAEEVVVRVTAPANSGQVPMTIPATLESEPTWS